MNWIELKALNELFLHQSVKKNETLRNSAELQYLADSLQLLQDDGIVWVSLDGFEDFYEKHYQTNFDRYYKFLNANGLLKPQARFEERDIATLIHIKEQKDEGRLDKLRKQIISFDESVRGVSQMFFKNEKYLDDRSSVVKALQFILDVPHFSREKDQQYLYKLECDDPQCIVLCENLDFLTKPNKPRANQVELWYAGGKNVEKLRYADPRGLPIFYSCDWDYDGLLIIYPLVKEKLPEIKLLLPDGPGKGIEETEHASKWTNGGRLAELAERQLFESSEMEIIKRLVAADQWIIEESNDLVSMLNL